MNLAEPEQPTCGGVSAGLDVASVLDVFTVGAAIECLVDKGALLRVYGQVNF